MSTFRVDSITINIPQAEIDHFKQLIALTRLPEDPIISGADDDNSWYGTKLGDLRRAKESLLNSDWRTTEAGLNHFHHFATEIENTRIHFIHEKSTHENAIPLLLLHGWPSSVWDFKDVIEPLTSPPSGSQAFHVVAPSLPGIFLSSVIPDKSHTTVNVARIFNTLMVDVLGYRSYGGQGGDFGAINLRQIQLNHPDHCKLVHFNGFPSADPTDFTQDEIKRLPEYEQRLVERLADYFTKRFGYLQIQTTEVASLAYATYDGFGMTSWLLGKFVGLMRRASTSESFHEAFWEHAMETLLIYQYTHSNHTSMLMYKQSGKKYIFDAFKEDGTKGAPMGASLYEGEFFFAPRESIQKSGNLVFYKYHNVEGGHSPYLAVPNEFVEDLREIFAIHWLKMPRI